MRNSSAESGSSSRKAEAKAARTAAAAAAAPITGAQAASQDKTAPKTPHQNMQNAINFGEQLQFMAMPASFTIV